MSMETQMPAAPSTQTSTGGDTGAGFLVGTDPAQPPRTAAEWAPVLNDSMAGDPAPQGAEGAPTGEQAAAPITPTGDGAPTSNFYTEEDLARVRREEKDKLYPEIQKLNEQLREQAEAREQAEQARRAAEEAELARKRAEEEASMDAHQLIAAKEAEWTSRFAELERKQAEAEALLEKERRFQELEKYRQQVIDQNAEYIMPQLRDLVTGSDEDEIARAVEAAKVKTQEIMAEVQAATQAAQVQAQSAFQTQARAAAPTAPPVGPMEQVSTTQTLTDEDIRTMDMETYRRHRATLLANARPR